MTEAVYNFLLRTVVCGSFRHSSYKVGQTQNICVLDSLSLWDSFLIGEFYYSRATKFFQEVLYKDPAFSRSKEVHLRLGIIFKAAPHLGSALKHFLIALNDKNPSSLSDSQIKFHIAHLHDVQNRQKIAKGLYEKLLPHQDLPAPLRADIYRNLGQFGKMWITHLEWLWIFFSRLASPYGGILWRETLQGTSSDTLFSKVAWIRAAIWSFTLSPWKVLRFPWESSRRFSRL